MANTCTAKKDPYFHYIKSVYKARRKIFSESNKNIDKDILKLYKTTLQDNKYRLNMLDFY